MFSYGICNETYQGWDWKSTCRNIAECGYQYVEVAPFTLADDVGTINASARSSIRQTAESFGLEIVGLHWLLVSPKGLSITSDDAAIRGRTAHYLAALVDFCADLGGKTMVLGSPAQRRLPEASTCGGALPAICAENRLSLTLEPALERCLKHSVYLCLEPLPAPEADFVLTLSEAAEIVDKIGHPQLRTILDIKSACSELTPIPVLIQQHHGAITHVHANDANRRGPGFGDTDYLPILQALIACGYNGPISVEVFDYSPDPVTIATQSLAYLKETEARCRAELAEQ